MTPGPALLRTCRSEEIEASYTLRLHGDRLVLRRPSSPDLPLEPVSRDTFRAPGIVLSFEQRAEQPRAFALEAGRVRNIRFERRPAGREEAGRHQHGGDTFPPAGWTAEAGHLPAADAGAVDGGGPRTPWSQHSAPIPPMHIRALLCCILALAGCARAAAPESTPQSALPADTTRPTVGPVPPGFAPSLDPARKCADGEEEHAVRMGSAGGAGVGGGRMVQGLESISRIALSPDEGRIVFVVEPTLR